MEFLKKIKAILDKIFLKSPEVKEYKGNSSSRIKNFFDKLSIKQIDSKSIDYLAKDRIINFLIRTNIISIILIVILVSGYPALFPLKEVVPYLVQFSTPQERIVRVQQAFLDETTDQALREQFARDYVTRRREITLSDLKSNAYTSDIDINKLEDYSSVILMSDDEVKEEFKKDYSVNNPNSRYLLSLKNNITVYIFIKRSTLLNRNQAQVDFVEKYSNKNTGKALGTAEFVATISMERRAMKFQGYDYLKNPYGLIVTKWTISNITNYSELKQ